MFKCKELDCTHMNMHGIKTEFLFGWEKPYPKLKTVRRIIEITDYYMKMYPDINLAIVGDGLSTVEAEQRLGLSERMMDNKIVTPQDDDVRAMHTYIFDIGCSIIVFNSYKLNELCNWNFGIVGNEPVKLAKDTSIKRVTDKSYVQYIFAHEFAHAIDAKYNLSNNELIQKIYEKQAENFKNIAEFIAECFVVSEAYSNNKIANDVRMVIDTIALNEN